MVDALAAAVDCCADLAPPGPGWDAPTIQCRKPDNCCLLSPCDIAPDDFMCAVRALLPEGDTFNAAAPLNRPPRAQAIAGTITVGCSKVGCQQLVFGGCCDDPLKCSDDPFRPQLAMVDAYAASSYHVLEALCVAIKELDPCTADLTVSSYAERYGIAPKTACDTVWSKPVTQLLLCTMTRLENGAVLNWEELRRIAEEFGATLNLHYAGDINCDLGWWTMARQGIPAHPDDCPTVDTCVAPPQHQNPVPPVDNTCVPAAISINIVICEGPVITHANCLMPGSKEETLPHDPERFSAFQWLLPKLLPLHGDICVVHCDPPNCIE